MLNNDGEVELDSIIMDGKTLATGAISSVRNIANPVSLARAVMEKVYVNFYIVNTVIVVNLNSLIVSIQTRHYHCKNGKFLQVKVTVNSQGNERPEIIICCIRRGRCGDISEDLM